MAATVWGGVSSSGSMISRKGSKALITAVATTALVVGVAPSMASAAPVNEYSQLAIRGSWCIQANDVGARLDMDDCESFIAPWQLWKLMDTDRSKTRLVNAMHDACLAENDEGYWITATCGDSTRQQWKVTTREVHGKQQVQLQNVATSRCALGGGDCASDGSWLTVIGTRF
ncbi:hypothetical protein [Streptomyces hydrogenans]|uniref:hypothetical protein n=1 Tax=Streptomyces hydrogenans TaxID=1873719 RepID=UPI00278BB307|nr:hypothetical protein [Streptomyces hydrogenans]